MMTYTQAVRVLAKEVKRLQERIAQLEELCGYAYQFAGELGAPVPVLNALFAATQGERFRVPPVARAYECNAVRDLERALLRTYDQLGEHALRIRGRKGGQARSAKKAAASRRNGQKGGRPSKFVMDDVTRSDYIVHKD